MDKASFDLPALVKWGVDKALGHLDGQTGLPLSENLGPLANGLIGSLGIQAIDVDPYMYAMGRLVVAGLDRQKKINEARSQANDSSTGER